MVEISDLVKEYPSATGPIRVLDGVSLSLTRGDAIAISGPSGSGKSTLLYLMGALDRPSTGSVVVDGTDVFRLSDSKQAAFRNQKIGFVFQDHALLPQCSVLENVLVPTLVADHPDGHEARATALLGSVGLSHRLTHKPVQLSGGERQRAAIARALIMNPGLVLCDEPTGNLDQESARNVADLLLQLHAEERSVLVVVTHSPELAARFPVRYQLRQQRLIRI